MYPIYQLYKRDFDSIIKETRYEPKTVAALSQVLVRGEKVSEVAIAYGMSKQQLNPSVRRIVRIAKDKGVKFKKIIEKPAKK